jgi:hypothetical protein
VLRLLPAEAVLSSATCRVFRAWASSDALWEALCRRDWGARAAAALAEHRREDRGGAPWRRVYAEVARLSALSARRVLRSPSAGARSVAARRGGGCTPRSPGLASCPRAESFARRVAARRGGGCTPRSLGLAPCPRAESP